MSRPGDGHEAALRPGQKVSVAGRPDQVGEIIGTGESADGIVYQVHFPADRATAWLPYSDLVVVRGIAERFEGAEYDSALRRFDLRGQARAMRWANAMTGELLASRIEPLPHQVLLTHRVVSGDPIRRLIADDVGLGKTIEAGMVVSALRSRGRADRVLFIVPAGLVPQWIEEMEEKFDIAVTRLVGESLPATARQWDLVRYGIGSIDLFKLHREKMEAAGFWDVLVIDEAHRLSRKGKDVALRYRLAEDLAKPVRCGALVLLTGTPHQGDNEKFVHLLRLVRPDLVTRFVDLVDNPRLVNEIIVRNRKLDVTDAEGRRIFDPPPSVETYRVKQSSNQRRFQRAMEGYLRASLERAGRLEEVRSRAVGFVMTTYSKLATSSPRAIGRALQRRAERFRPAEALTARAVASQDERFLGEVEEASSVALAAEKDVFFDGESEALSELTSLIVGCEESDTKRKGLLEIVTRLLEANAEERFLIFTEYRGTQEYLAETLRSAFPRKALVLIHGSQSLDARQAAVEAFNTEATFLVSTEAGAEGINLQERCHIMVNYDLPWNPMRLRQRVGRLYRYGQERQVIVVNLRTDGSTDELILEHLETKIEQVVHDLAELEGDREENLREDVLGRTVAEVPIEELVMAVHRGRSIERVKEDVSEHMEKVRSCAGMQRALLAEVEGFSLEEYEKIRCPFGPTDVRRWLIGAVRELGGSVKDEGDALTIGSPTQMVRAGRNIQREYFNVVTERRGVQRRRREVQFLFGHRAFDALVDEVERVEFGGDVARRKVHLAGVRTDACFFEFHFAVDWLSRDLASAIEEFVVVLVSPDGTVCDEPWVKHLIRAESTSGDAGWDPTPEERRRAFALARTWVDGRKVKVLPARRAQPGHLVAAALLSVAAV